MSHTTYFKPAPGQWKVDLAKRKAMKRTEANRVERALKLDARRAEMDIRRDVYERDAARCRACGEALTFSGALTELMHAHHVLYRSAGGSDALENRAALCFECHRDEHDHTLRITGQPNGTLELTRVNLETGEVIQAWDSPCPNPPEEL